MSRTVYKHYKLKCKNCDILQEKEKLLSSNEDFENVSNDECESDDCNSKEFYVVYGNENGAGVMINSRENWKKKVPGEFKEWLDGPFSKRHGRGQTINTTF